MHVWKAIHESKLPQAQWILCDDLNQVEDLTNYIGGEFHTRMNSQEINEW